MSLDSFGMPTELLADSLSLFHREPIKAMLGAQGNSSIMILEKYSEI